MHFLRATGTNIDILLDGPLTTGSVGMQLKVELSDDFDGLTSIICFRGSGQSADFELTSSIITIPSGLLVLEGDKLRVGIYASNRGGTIVIPTIWATMGLIYRGASPSNTTPVGDAPSWASEVISEVNGLIDRVYPVGAVYTSVDSTASPGTLFGGTWQSISVPSGLNVYMWKRTA